MPPSVAFRAALDEVIRVWDAADHLDTKILQFTSIVTAGALAGAGLAVGRTHGVFGSTCGRGLWLGGGLLILGILGFSGFFVFMLRSAIGTRFAGPLDPRELAKRPELLSDDAKFERELLPSIAAAFETSRAGLARKVRLFWIGSVLLGLSALLMTSALLVIWLSSF